MKINVTTRASRAPAGLGDQAVELLDPALAIPQIGAELGCCRASVYRLYINTGRLKTFKVGSGRRARRSAVRELKARLEAEATPQ